MENNTKKNEVVAKVEPTFELSTETLNKDNLLAFLKKINLGVMVSGDHVQFSSVDRMNRDLIKNNKPFDEFLVAIAHANPELGLLENKVVMHAEKVSEFSGVCIGSTGDMNKGHSER
jgi:hypothetical protein